MTSDGNSRRESQRCGRRRQNSVSSFADRLSAGKGNSMNMQEDLSGADLFAKLNVLDQCELQRRRLRSLCGRRSTRSGGSSTRRTRSCWRITISGRRFSKWRILSAIRSSSRASRRKSRDADLIVFCGVHFMAETAKVFNPDRTVLLPDMRAGCSLADSINADDLAERRDELLKLYPDLKIVSYVNCTADVKALSDACCTSANAAKVVNAIDFRTYPVRARPESREFRADADHQADHFVGRQLLRASSDNRRGGRKGARRGARNRRDCPSGMPQGRDRDR